jgi:hypothetical protein
MGNYARVLQPQMMKPAKSTLFAGGIAPLHGLAAETAAGLFQPIYQRSRRVHLKA